MIGEEDWLEDPLSEKGRNYRKLKNPNKGQDLWKSFHFSTRLKLDAADYFCRQLLGAASMPDNLGLPLLAYRQLKWNLDAFFFELMSAYDILLQELNIVFAYDLELEPSQVEWRKIKKKVPKELVQYMDTERQKEWFKKIKTYRNMATHHAYVPVSSWIGGSGDKPLDYDEHNISMMPIPYLDSSGQPIVENINQCKTYLKKTAKHIIYIWGKMVQEFQ